VRGRRQGWHTRLVVLLAASTLVTQVAAARPTTTDAGRATARAARGADAAGPFPWPLPAECTSPPANPGFARLPATDAFSTDLSDLGAGLKVRRLYAVAGDHLVPKDGLPVSRDCDVALWSVVQAATPKGLRGYLDELLLFDGTDDSPDGELLGEVQPARTDPTRWRLALRLDATDSNELLLTIAHEIGHLVTLNADETAPSFSDEECPTVVSAAGCMRPTALLTRFISAQWSRPLLEEWAHAADIQADSARRNALDAFYDKHADEFVTPYAATSPQEDIAESYAYWCLYGPDGDPNADVPGDGAAKLHFLEDQVQLRLDAGAGCARLRRLLR
jgi:hypothetical protein